MAERYRLDVPLGRGSMGEVWRAWDERLERPVALKLLAERATDDEALTARFEREARTAARLNDPHLVSVYDFGVSGDHCFLIMELVEGHDLAEELRRRGPLPADQVARIATQAAAGLSAAHEHGVVHRDVKPSNLVLAEGGTVKIADFGIARGLSGTTAADITQTGAVMGTSLYIAPETALGRSAGTAGDVYSLGCTLYELLTGAPPFVAENPLAVLRLHVETEPPPPDAPRALAAYLLAMLAKDPRLRPSARQAADWFATDAWREADAAGPGAGAGSGFGFGAGLTSTVPVSLRTPPAAATHRQPHHQASRRVPGRHLLAGAALAAAALTAAGLALAPSSADGSAPPASPGAASRPASHSVTSSQPSGSGGGRHLPSSPRSSDAPAAAPTRGAATASPADDHSTRAATTPRSAPPPSPSTTPTGSPSAEPSASDSPAPTDRPTTPSATPTPPTASPSESPIPSPTGSEAQPH
ncbi:protein kinase [Streptomyces sp. NBC_01476]|uniref:serine/threonine-protein kinase n=1 Tax=Streptomyces sp. NBC_01476 TaxID=2903881 RepID=UPI002E35D5E5|nr:protein kinase [Streptomyces sp. NBC_01476]